MDKRKGESQPAETAQPGPILVVDDDGDIRTALEMLLRYDGFAVWTAKSAIEAEKRMELEQREGRRPALILSDVKMPGMDGVTFLDRIQERGGGPPVIMISGHADVAMAVDAVRRGAVNFLEKPLDQNRVLVSIKNALLQGRLASENRGLKRQLSGKWQLIGESESMASLRAQVERVAGADAPVLITGENGTGKEVVARNIHLLGPRAGGPFVAVNCAAIPGELIESELFGHEKGSFTGAHERRIGHFEAAGGGTLFLDEIGDMPLPAQAKVLRALETREITRVGGTHPIRVDIRVVAATNADLAQGVEDKSFRMDLFYRLNVVPLRVPSLHERASDVPLLAAHFLEDVANRTGRLPLELEPGARELLSSMEYPGNVRQLRNLIEGAYVFADGGTIRREDLEQILEAGQAMSRPANAGLGTAADPFQAETFEEFKNASEALFFRRKLAENDGVVKRTAENLGMQRSHLYKKLDRYHLR